MHLYAVSMGLLTPLLTNWVGKPIQDKTGLTVKYDFPLQRPALDGEAAQFHGGGRIRVLPSLSHWKSSG